MGNIKCALDPKTIALIGATEDEESPGRIAFENLLQSKGRKIFPVNPHNETVFGLPCYPDITKVPGHIDLGVIITPAGAVPRIVEECGIAGVEGVVILSAGFRAAGEEGKRLESEIVETKKKYGMRIIGTDSLGVIRPNIGLYATFLKHLPDRGNIAFISQSGGFGRALLDWAAGAHIGFSLFASVGSMIDVDFGDLIDFLGEDPHTRSIIIYVERGLGDVRKFTSAARCFARNKPIIILKPGNLTDYERPSRTHAANMVGSDDVCDALFKRIGVVKVKEASDLFNLAGALCTRRLPAGPRLLVITNTAAAGIIAANTLISLGGELARLSAETVQKLYEILPVRWNGTNPVHVLRDADVERFSRTAGLCLGDPSVDGVLIIYTPQGAAKPDELARAVIDIEAGSWKPVIATCMGGKDVREGRDILCCKNIPVYGTPEEAVRTYLYMYNYKRNLGLLYETPGELSIDCAPPKNNLKAFIRRAVKKEWDILSEEQSRRFLDAYGIPAMNIRMVRGVEEAVIAAGEIGYPVVLKIASPDIVYRIDVGGVITGISTEAELRQEYVRLLDRVKQNAPQARIEGVIVQKMLEKIDYEVILGAKKDSEFGSVILFGMGGVGVEVFRDFSVGLPPLNQTLARRLMEETEVYKMLKGHRGRPPADLRQIEEIIVSFSNLIVDFPEIAEMDINPIAVSNGRAYALDARIVIDRSALDQPTLYPHLVIMPYPVRYVTAWALPDGTEILFRPIKPEDEPLEHEMLGTLSEDTMRARFFQEIKSISHEMLVRFCNIDYDRELAIVAEVKVGEKRRIAAIGRLIMDSGCKSGEYAVLVHDDYQGKGLGYKLGDIFIGIANDRGLEEIYGYVQRTNSRMIRVFKKLGFTMERAPDRMDMARLKLAFK